MAPDRPRLEPEQQARAREYARKRRRLLLAELLLGATAALLWLVSGASARLRDVVLAWSSKPHVSVAAYALVAGSLYALLGAPLAYYGGFHLPRRYALLRQSFGQWLWDRVKATLLTGLFTLAILEGGYLLLRGTPALWWLWTALVMALASLLLSGLAPLVIFPLFYRFSRLEDGELVARLERLADKAGARVRGVFSFDMSRKTVEANAAVVGIGQTRRIVIADTLLDDFTSDEIETVLAHELGHHVHGDLGKGLLVQAVLTTCGLWLAAQGLAWGVIHFGYAGVTDVAAMPILALAMGAFGLVTTPLSNTYSRWREREADRYALRVTQKPEAFAAAMTRLAAKNLADADPERWVEILLSGHPAIGRRVAMAREWS